MKDRAMQKFLSTLDMLARHCNYPLTADMIELFDKKLSIFPYDTITETLEEYFCLLSPGSKMPSVMEIACRINGESLPISVGDRDDAEARLAASNIVAASRRYGHVIGNQEDALEKMQDIRKMVGPLAWRMIAMKGGWNAVNDSLRNDTLANTQADLRETAKAIAIQDRLGLLPALPQPKPVLVLESPRAPLSPLSDEDIYPQFLLNMKNRKKKDVDDAETAP